MSRPFLAFREVEVRRSPGFPRGGPRLARLAAGINLVHGPNESGKTTMAQATQGLLWSLAEPRWSVAGAFEIEGAGWRADLDAGRLAFERDGAPAGAPPLPPAEVRDRYRLALELLLAGDDAELARAVQRESAGGYDLSAAALGLGLRERPSGPGAATRELERAEERLKELRAAQDLLRDDQDRLALLDAELEAAQAARRDLEALEQAVAAGRAAAECARWEERLAAHSPTMAALAGDEGERLAGERARLADLAERRARHLDELGRLREALAAAALPAAGVAPAARGEIGARLDALAQAEREVEAAERALEAARGAGERALADLDPEGNLERWERRSLPAAAHALDDLLGRSERLRAAAELRRLARHLLAPEGEGAEGERGQVAEGIALLSRWLAAPARGTGIAALAALALGLAALAVGASAAGGGDPRLGLPAAAAGAALVGLGGSLALAASRRAALARRFRRTGLAAPERWREGEVSRRLAGLEGERERARRAEAAARVWAAVDAGTAALEGERGALDARRRELAAGLGAAPDLAALGVAVLAARLSALEAALDRAAEAGAQLAACRRQREGARTGLATGLAPYGYGEPAGHAAARAAVEDLERRQRAFEAAEADRRAVERAIGDLDLEVAAAERRVADLFGRSGLPPGDDAALAHRLSALPAYRAAAAGLAQARAARDGARSALGERADLSRLPLAELEAGLERARQAAASEAPLSLEIGKARERLAAARRGHDLERALARRDACREALAEARSRDLEAVAGWVLSRHLRREAAAAVEAPVLARARDLFARLTGERYRLLVQDGDPACFRAEDRRGGPSRSLAELSTGSRVQLLLAVRLAFIEHHERGLALPLLLDDALATSDPERAAALIEAVVEVARAGRQVLVFTPRPEEAALWASVLEDLDRQDRGVEHLAIDLGEAARGAEGERRPLPPAPPRRPAVPPPGELSYEDYGRLLGVCSPDPRAEGVGGVHLWHLLDDPVLLHRFLAAGFTTWGQAQGLLERGAADGLGPGAAAALSRAAAAARALEAALGAWRIGRGRPLDRLALAESAAVSSRYLEAVAGLARAAGGDARALLERLAAGAVPGFRSAKREELATFLEGGGYLDPRPPLSGEEIRRRVLAAAADDLGAGRLALDHLDRLLAQLPL